MQRRTRIVLVMMLTIGTLGAISLWTPRNSSSTAARSESPIQPRASEARGRYLVQIAGCNDCHTEGYAQRAGDVPESEWLTGSAIGWHGSWGTTYPTNLRRFVQGVTLEQWLERARSPMRPPMPWFALREMTDDDLSAIYYYIRALGPAGPNAPTYVPPEGTVRTKVIEFVPRASQK